MPTVEALELLYNTLFKKQAAEWRFRLLRENRMWDTNLGSAGGPAWTLSPEESKWCGEGGPIPESVKNPGREKQRIYWYPDEERYAEASPEFWEKYWKSQDINQWLDQWLEANK